MHPAGLDMTRGSLQDILDGEDVNVSTALPTVPLDATNPFINPNQTLADIIPGPETLVHCHHSKLQMRI